METYIFHLIITSLTMGSVYGIVALCFQMIFKVTQILNFAQGSLVMLGALITFLGISLPFKIPFVLIFFFTISIAWVIGLIYEKLLVRPLINSSLISVIVVTAAALTLINNGIDLSTGKFPVRVHSYVGDISFSFLNNKVNASSLLVIGVTIITLLFTKLFFDYTLVGKGMKAVGDNPIAAKLVGINTKKMISYIFALTNVLGSIAGIVVSPTTFICGSIGLHLTIIGFTSAILGGLKTPFSAVLGGYIFGFIETFGVFYISSAYKEGISFGVLILILLLKPEGLFTFKRNFK